MCIYIFARMALASFHFFLSLSLKSDKRCDCMTIYVATTCTWEDVLVYYLKRKLEQKKKKRKKIINNPLHPITPFVWHLSYHYLTRADMLLVCLCFVHQFDI